MNCAPTLSAEEFSTIHNALCDLDSLARRLEDVINSDLYQRLNHAATAIRAGLARAYQQDREIGEQRWDHYRDVQNQLGLGHSVWSINEVNNLSDRHPYEGADRVVYRNHWGDRPVSCSVQGLTWAALWTAANACIRDSGDDHHIFIESFEPDAEDPRTLMLSTGS